MSSYYAVAKASALTRYKPKLMYLPPKSDTLDYQHEATLNFFPTIFSSSDNRLYLFSSTESEPLANFCVNGKGNLGQITALDTFLNEKWVKYVHPRSGHCIKSFCIAPCAGRKGLLVSGLEFPLSDPDNQTLWKAFIYHVDSSTSLGIDADHPVSITSQFYLSPNPATDFVAINNALGDPFTYSLTGTNGQIISEGNGQNTSTKLSLSNLSPGFYLVTIKSKTGQLHHLKFIRQ
jgi:hypothetical protein